MPVKTPYLLDRYRPQPGWFTHNPWGIHGLGHVARVLVWADQVGQAMQAEGEAADMETVRWAASVHDVGRVDDGRDRPHGSRSAAWVKQNLARFAPDLTAGQIDQVAYLCIWHVPDDRDAPKLTPELKCLKDADALDRVRIYDLDPARLRTARAHDLVNAAEALFRESKARAGSPAGDPTDDPANDPAGDPWENVRRCALRAGFWR